MAGTPILPGYSTTEAASLVGLSPGRVRSLVRSGFLAARRVKGGADLRERGLPRGSGRLLVYASSETHTWIQKAADLFGHGTSSVRWIPVGSDLTIDTEALSRQQQEPADGFSFVLD